MTGEAVSTGRCDGCGVEDTPLIKVSLAKDFFKRPYDRLLPQQDPNPRWFCSDCSEVKKLQRDYRDIKAEYDRAVRSEPNELSGEGAARQAASGLAEIYENLIAGRFHQPLMKPEEVLDTLLSVKGFFGLV